MKLNNSYLGVLYETDSTLKDFYLREHLNERHRLHVDMQPLLAEEQGVYYDKTVTNGWEMRERIANELVKKPEKMYLITDAVQEVCNEIKFDKVDLKWFKQVRNQSATYITDKFNFFRFVKSDTRINVLNYYLTDDGAMAKYDCYSLILNDGVLATLPSQDKDKAQFFFKLMLFIELGEITEQVVKVNSKVVYGKKGNERIKNESGMEVRLINTTWNKIIVVEGGFSVRQHLRVQGCGKGRSDYRLVWVSSYTKGSYVRRAGKQLVD